MAKKASKPVGKQDNSKIVAILSYFLVGIIWYFVDETVKKSSLAKYHVKQAINLLIIEIVVFILASVVMWIPVVGAAIHYILWVFFVVIWIIGLINAVNGAEKEVPIVGQFAERYLTF